MYICILLRYSSNNESYERLAYLPCIKISLDLKQSAANNRSYLRMLLRRMRVAHYSRVHCLSLFKKSAKPQTHVSGIVFSRSLSVPRKVRERTSCCESLQREDFSSASLAPPLRTLDDRETCSTSCLLPSAPIFPRKARIRSFLVSSRLLCAVARDPELLRCKDSRRSHAMCMYAPREPSSHLSNADGTAWVINGVR